MRDPRDFQFDLPVCDRPGKFKLNEKWHSAARRAAKACTSPRRLTALDSVRTIIIHATAGSSTDGAVSVMREGRASFHWLVPDENEPAHGNFVWATAPERRAAWHVRGSCSHSKICNGATGLNQLSLGIEIVNAQSGGDRFSDWQVKATAEIIRYAWAKYPKLRHVVSHARLDPERRSDPGANFPWEQFEALILQG